MPPRQKLAETEINDLEQWVRDGAFWPAESAPQTSGQTDVFDLAKRKSDHWSWQPIQPLPPPKVQPEPWPLTEVDQFLLAKLEASDLTPAPAADRRTLLRRVYYDLTGLPPTPAEVEAFLSDRSPEAFARVVDHLLDSPRFGERWARHWLDLVRYAETLGHEFDYTTFNAWRYRDYVIRAFNVDVPYDQFLTEHIAGDLLSQPRLGSARQFNESILGTGFYWLGQRVHSPVDVRLEQAEVIDNQIDVATKTFLGLTVACARCHDHKFDAISTRDYYALYGVFASSRYTQATLTPPADLPSKISQLRDLKRQLPPLLSQTWLSQVPSITNFLAAARELASDQPSETSNHLATVAANHNLAPDRLARWHAAITKEDPAHLLNALAESYSYNATAPTSSLTKSKVSFTEAAAATDQVQIHFSPQHLDEWSLEDEAFALAPLGDFIVGSPDRPVLGILSEPAASSATISRRLEGVLRSPTFTIRQPFLHLLVSGADARLNVRIDNFTMIRDPIYGGLKRTIDRPAPHWTTIDLSTWQGHRAYLELNDMLTPDPSDDADKRFSPRSYVVLSRIVFSSQPQPPASTSAAPRLAPSDPLLVVAANEAIRAWSQIAHEPAPSTAAWGWLDWLVRHSLLDDPAHALAPQVAAILTRFQQIEDSIEDRPRAVAMIEGTGLDEHVFIRGSHRTPGEIVERRFLEALGGSATNRFLQGSGRLELARAMTDPGNPFPARVMVNRVWQHLFGRGIVPTPDDFGVLGSPPSHPELLDWLAAWYRNEARWSTKQLIRLLVKSRAYQMTSFPSNSDAELKDPQNALLHRMNTRRLEAEPIRDTLLAVSGALDATMFGPPVPVFLTDFMDGRGRPASSGPLNGAGRRSIYQEVRRNFLPPMMRTFDFPVPFTTIGKRTSSNVPAQSLILLNDPFVAGQARAWAQAVLTAPADSAEARIRLMYQTLFSRPPLDRELAESLAFLQCQSAEYGLAPDQWPDHEALWADYAHVLVNLKEFIFLN